MQMHSRRALVVMAATLAIVSSAKGQKKESLLIGPGDMLHVQVLDTPELDQHARVTDAGDIPLLLVGDLNVCNRTPEQAAGLIEKTLIARQFMLHPKVAVTVDEYATQKVSIFGEVKIPGAYAIATPRPVLDVLTLAGGLNDVADRKVIIERAGTRQQINYFVSNKANEALDASVEVRPGDSIIVSKAGIVYVLGDVARPGGYTMTNNDAQITVLQLVARAGGTNHSAIPAKAKLIHKDGSTYTESPLALSAMQKGKQADMPLQSDDIIWVPFSYLRNFGSQGAGIVSAVGSAAVYHF